MSISAMFTYNMASGGAKELANALEIPRIKHTGSKFKASPSKVLLNWGASSDRFPEVYNSCTILNRPTSVDVAVNKVSAFNAFREAGVSIPDFTTTRSVALEWLRNGHTVFARTRLRDHSGRGIHIMEPDFEDTWNVEAPLYVKYVPKKHEFRVHVFRGRVIDVQRKGLREEFRGQTDVNWKVRNLQNGFVYIRNDGMEIPNIVQEVGVSAVNAINLDFGAADIIYNQKANLAYALEVNCAPGLQGTTVIRYTEALRSV